MAWNKKLVHGAWLMALAMVVMACKVSLGLAPISSIDYDKVHTMQIVDFQNCSTDDPFGLGKADGGNRTDNGGNHRGDHRDDQGDGDGFQHGPVAEHVFIPTQGESGEIGLGFPFVEGKQDQIDNGQVDEKQNQDEVKGGEYP